MKKTLKLLALLMVCLMPAALWSCSDDDDDDRDEPASWNMLPGQAKSFIDDYYDGMAIKYIKRDVDDGVVEYDVKFVNGQEITFDDDGRWIDVDAPDGMTVPAGIVPAQIDDYVGLNYPGDSINEISRESWGYDVDLNIGPDLMFDHDFRFIGLDF